MRALLIRPCVCGLVLGLPACLPLVFSVYIYHQIGLISPISRSIAYTSHYRMRVGMCVGMCMGMCVGTREGMY